ncbi:MAG: bifunctional SulP family inorganic anion transporter/carbonic anhydrase [Pirellulales bacterium]|nr:bifunctional SulP family inorganic anion transporter/carbonic anhydrase [Pirellulales bacterium]
MSTSATTPNPAGPLNPSSIVRDLLAGTVVFLVALPLCLGIALASNAPLISGIIAGIVAGIVVGLVSGSQVSVSGPAAGLTAVVAAQIAVLGSFQAFLLAVVIAGVMQIVLGLMRAEFIAAFFPTSVVKGLLAAIGLLLILKQLPHLLGDDTDPEGEMSFFQPDMETTLTEVLDLPFHIHPGATAIGLSCIGLLILWDRWPALKRMTLPIPLAVVALGIAISVLLDRIGGKWAIGPEHLVQVPVAQTLSDFFAFQELPDFSQWRNPAVYLAALTIALVASLESLLNLEVIDKLDPRQRTSPRGRELVAQGVGNVTTGLLGGIPVATVIVRSSLSINSGAQSKLATIFHGGLLFVSVMALPTWLNTIPLACLAAILIVTGAKLASPQLVRQMWAAGRYQFVPFVVTVVAIVFTDLLTGILVGLAVSISFILNSNLRRPLRRVVEKHLGGDVLHIELANQVSFLNRASLAKALDNVPRGGHVLLDAQGTDYIDPDVLDMIRDFKLKKAPARQIEVSLVGFRNKYQLQDQIHYVDYSTRELQKNVTPAQVLQILKEGHERFRRGRRLNRDLGRQVLATAAGQHPLAVVLSCIDSRTPAELVFDLGVGDIFSVRIAGNVTSRKILGSIEYGCAVAGAKLILVMGHTRCGAVSTAVNLYDITQPVADVTGCQNVETVLGEIQKSIDRDEFAAQSSGSDAEKEAYTNGVARANVRHSVASLVQESETLAELVRLGRIAIVGAMYDVTTGEMHFLDDEPEGMLGMLTSHQAG